MQEMIEFSSFIFQSLIDFVSTPPIFYIFGLTCFLFIIKALKIILKLR